MSSTTAHFHLTKPASNENYGVSIVNNNSDIIDQQMYNNQQSAAKIMVGATANVDGESGRVPAPTSGDKDKYLKGDGTWDTPSGGVDMTGATASTAGTHGLVPAPSAGDNEKFLRGDGTWQPASGGGGSSTLVGLTDVDISSPTNGQVLKYNSTTQKWENADESGGKVISPTMTELNNGTKTSNTYVLSDDISNYDEISFMWIYNQATPYMCEKRYYVQDLLNLLNQNFGASSFLIGDAAGNRYSWLTLTNESTLTIQSEDSNIIMQSIRGITYESQEIVTYDYAMFDGTGYITTPFNINSDYTVEVTFDANYISPSSVYGNMTSPSYSHLTMYANNWYMSNGAGEISPIAYTSGKHTFKSNSNGKNIMDNTEISNYTPTSYATPYVIGNRYASGCYQGKLYGFKLTSISTGDVIYNLIPAKKGEKIGLYDTVSGTFTQHNFITSVAND